MNLHLVSYSSPEFYRSHVRLEASARRFGIQTLHSWDRDKLVETDFYRSHRHILDQRRGSGYWLWKPYIVQLALATLAPGDVLFYGDAGLEITAELAPLAELCRAKDGVLVFAGHYDDVVHPGPHRCRHWTKRDCFVAMGCDTPEYYDARTLDASFLAFARTARSQALVRDWLGYACQDELITDSPNRLGLPNLDGFYDHRHDQSILSLLAARDGLEIFRHPSQMGNHAKRAELLVVGEPLFRPWGVYGVFENSPYPTLLYHHRESAKHVLRPELLDAMRDPGALRLDARRGAEALWRAFEALQKDARLERSAFVLRCDGLSPATVETFWRIWKALQVRLGLGAESFHLGRASSHAAVDDYTGLIVRGKW